MPPPQYKPVYHSSWALLVGINDYRNGSPLSYACNDVDVLHNVLISTLGFPEQNVFILKDTKATKQNILDQFINFHKQANHPGQIVVFLCWPRTHD